jgi:RNA-directed DNA polymerase
MRQGAAGGLAGTRGLAFNEDKTSIVRLGEGFDFLGFNVRRYNRKLLIKPSEAAVNRIRERLAAETRRLRGSNAAAVIAALAPVVRGWAAYYRTVVSSKVFQSLDNYLWGLLCKWARWRHKNKPRTWIVARYFGKFSKFRNDRWVFGDRDSGAYLVRFSWTGIERHVMVKGAVSPDDPALASYWAQQRRRSSPRSTGTPCACSPGRTGAARCAGTTCCPLSSHPSLPANGSGGGSTSPAGR